MASTRHGGKKDNRDAVASAVTAADLTTAKVEGPAVDDPGHHLDDILQRARQAAQSYRSFTQAQVDEIVAAAALAGAAARIPLAESAMAETGMGVMEDKVMMNHFATEFVHNQLRGLRTCGVIAEDKPNRTKTVAHPAGVVIALIPVTVPTSTTLFKSLINLKARNAVIFAPHPRAPRCTTEAVRVMYEAAVAAGAPVDILQVVEEPSKEDSAWLMAHGDLTMATGGAGMVKAAYSSGKPALGVGGGNTPTYFHRSVDLERAVEDVIRSKTFNYGILCPSESALIVDQELYEPALVALTKRGCHRLSRNDVDRLRSLIGSRFVETVGQSAAKIAEMAGFSVPVFTKVLLAESEVDTIGRDDPLAHEKMSPILTLYAVGDLQEAVVVMNCLLAVGGMGHTAAVHAQDQEALRFITEKLPVGRLLVNQPASLGSAGDVYNFGLMPSMTLGCGTWGGNIISRNVGVMDLVNTTIVADRHQNIEWLQVPPKIFWGPGSLKHLSTLSCHRRAVVVTDRMMVGLGFVGQAQDWLAAAGVSVQVFDGVEPNPSVDTVRRIAAILCEVKPDLIVALGGGSPIDAAKAGWLFYERPEVDFKQIAVRFMDIRKRIFQVPSLGEKARFIAIPTTSGTGSEITPFTVITDEQGEKLVVADYELTPHCVIIDSDLVMTLPKLQTATTGIDALSHAVEAYVSIMASDYTDPMALQAAGMLFRYLPRAYAHPDDREAREKVHNAATIAGMAFANASVGICHSLSHTIGGAFHLPHGLANAILLPHVIRYNGVEVPHKYATWSRYAVFSAPERYARMVAFLGLELEAGAGSEFFAGLKPGPEALAVAVTRLARQLDLPVTLQAAGVPADEFEMQVKELARMAFDDQCTGTNPRYPLIAELEALFRQAYAD